MGFADEARRVVGDMRAPCMAQPPEDSCAVLSAAEPPSQSVQRERALDGGAEVLGLMSAVDGLARETSAQGGGEAGQRAENKDVSTSA